jgi:hypothetical protein
MSATLAGLQFFSCSEFKCLFLDDDYHVLPLFKPFVPTSIPAMQKHIAAAMVTMFSAMNELENKPPIKIGLALCILDLSAVETCGRLRQMGAGDTMIASGIVKGNMEDRCDATFVRVRSF